MKIVLTSAVEHNGKLYEAGDTVDVASAAATQLIASGVAIKAGKSVDSAEQGELAGEPAAAAAADGQQPLA